MIWPSFGHASTLNWYLNWFELRYRSTIYPYMILMKKTFYIRYRGANVFEKWQKALVPRLFWITFAIQSLKWKRPINFCAIKHVQNICRYTLLSTKVICLGAYLIQSHLNTCPWFSSKWFFTVTKQLWADRTQLSMHELFCLKSHFLVLYVKHIIHVNKV